MLQQAITNTLEMSSELAKFYLKGPVVNILGF